MVTKGGGEMKFEFLDIVVNEYASENNPHRKGIFIRNNGRAIELTDGKGHFWKTVNDSDSRFQIIGNLMDKVVQL